MLSDRPGRLDHGQFRELAPPHWTSVLQRVTVRMLFDPLFAGRIYGPEGEALWCELELPRSYLEQIRRHDSRVWNADRLRRMRAMKGLLAEFKASSALWLAATRSQEDLLSFFSSETFHRAVQSRGYLALAYGSWLELKIQSTAHVAAGALPTLRLESALALARRELREVRSGRPARQTRHLAPGEVRLRPGYRAVSVPSGTLSCLQAVEAWLFELSLLPVMALCRDARGLEGMPLPGSTLEGFLVEPTPSLDVQLSDIPVAYARLGEVFHEARTRSEFPSIAAALNLPEVEEMVDSLLTARVMEAG